MSTGTLTPRTSSSTVTRGLGRFGLALFFLGLLLFAVYVWNRADRSPKPHATVPVLRPDRAPVQRETEVRALPADVTPDFSLWSPKRIRAYHASFLTNLPPTIGVLQISALRVQVPVLEGTDDVTLDRGVGHIAGTPAPGQLGNIGIAGHRDGFFRGLKDLPAGSAIDLYSTHGKLRYIVDDIQIVSPKDVTVLEPGAKSSLTLVTCYPFYFVGSAPMRYIVHATLLKD